MDDQEACDYLFVSRLDKECPSRRKLSHVENRIPSHGLAIEWVSLDDQEEKSGHAVAAEWTQVKPGMEAATGDRPSAMTLSRIASWHGCWNMMRVSLYGHHRERWRIVKEKMGES